MSSSRAIFLIAVAAGVAASEVRTLSLREAVGLALKQNPEITLARLDEQKAGEAVREARDPFTPKLAFGSGLAYTSGFPMSIEGSAPSVVQARAIQSFYNRPLSFQVAAARENARGAGMDVAIRRDEVAYRVALIHLDAQRTGQIADLVAQQVASFEKIANAVRVRVEEGRELPVEARAAELRVAQARQRLQTLTNERDRIEAELAIAVGLDADDRVRASVEEQAVAGVPESEAAAVDQALANSSQLKRLDSAMHAKQLQSQGARSGRYPQIDLVAQYALMARFNNYEEFFRRFQRNNYQLGMSLQIPIFAGSSHSARAAQTELEARRIQVQINSTRDRIQLDTRKAWRDLQSVQAAREVARLDLEVTRERLSVALAQFEEGRLPMSRVEELRSAESEKWLAFFDAQQAVERARIDLLRNTGTLTAALR